MKHLQAKREKVAGQPHQSLIYLNGSINASTIEYFEGVLDAVLMENRMHLILNLSELEYINSSGVSTIINYYQSFKAKEDELILIEIPHSVQLVLSALGVPNLVPCLKSMDDAQSFLGRKDDGSRIYASWKDFVNENPTGIATQDKPEVALDLRQGSVLVIEPREDLFSEVLQLRLNGKKKARFKLVHDIQEAQDVFDETDPDVIILRDSISRSEDFLNDVKVEKGKSLVSVIKVYETGTDMVKKKDFKVWEDDYFVEPFDIQELFHLAETELKRVPRDKQVLLHQVRFQFRTSEQNIDKASALTKGVVTRSGMTDDDSTQVYQAFREAVDNARRHGHKGSSEQYVDVSFLIDRDKVEITVEDEGEGFDYDYFISQLENEDAYVRARKAKAEGRRGGLGILLMHKCVDSMSYLGKGNIIKLEKFLTHA